MAIIKECRNGMHLFEAPPRSEPTPDAPFGRSMMPDDARCFCGRTTWGQVNTPGIPFEERRTAEQYANDINVYKREDGKVGADEIFFDTVAKVVMEFDPAADAWMLTLLFNAGGKLLLVRGAEPCWIEPERH